MSRRPVSAADNRKKWVDAMAAMKRGERDAPAQRPTAEVELVDDPFLPGCKVRKSLAGVYPSERFAHSMAAAIDETQGGQR